MEYYLIALLCITFLPGLIRAMRPTYKPITFYTAFGDAITGELRLYDEFRDFCSVSIAGIAPECLKYTGSKWKLKTAPMLGTKPIVFEAFETGEKIYGEYGVAEYYLKHGPFRLTINPADQDAMETAIFDESWARRAIKKEYCLGKSFAPKNP